MIGSNGSGLREVGEVGSWDDACPSTTAITAFTPYPLSKSSKLSTTVSPPHVSSSLFCSFLRRLCGGWAPNGNGSDFQRKGPGNTIRKSDSKCSSMFHCLSWRGTVADAVARAAL